MASVSATLATEIAKAHPVTDENYLFAMSRSRKRLPIFGNATAESEKYEKQKANRVLRANVRAALAREDEVLPALREVSDVWLFSKDGKRFWVAATTESLRK